MPLRVTAGAKGLEVRAPAKVNLFLEVLGRRADGFHEIDTVFQAVSVYDRLRLVPAEGLVLALEGESAEVPGGGENLVLRAAAALAERCRAGRGASIRLEKRIPPGAGLGGGSSDAAATLAGLDRLWEANLPQDLLLEVAARLGSDVPFFLLGGTARGRGRGEVLQPVSPRRPLWYLIVWPGVRLRTAEVYEEVEVPGSEARRSPGALIEALERGDVEGVAAGMFNRLERAAARREPAVDEALERVRRAGALGAQVSGSGSAVFGLFPDRRAADSAMSRLARRSSSEAVWVAHTVT